MVFVILTYCQGVFNFQCDESTVGSCHCASDKKATYQLHCPSYQPDKKRLDVLVKPREFAQVSCVRGTTSEEVFSLLKQLQLGELKTLKFNRCPFPLETYQKTIENMGITGVRSLVIQGDPRKSLDKSLMRNLTVIALDLRYSANVEVDEDFFKNSSSIQRLHFRGIRGLQLNKHSFNHLPNLTNLGISCGKSCGINTLDKDVFKNLTALEDLNLHGNALTELPDGIFDNLSNLTKLNLGNNRLRSLPKNVFQYNDKIEEAILSFNCFDSLPDNLFAGKQNLGVFDFRRLNDKNCKNKSIGLELPGTMLQNSSVTEIKLLHIDVESIPEDFLKGCKSLKEIIIQSAYIKTIPKDLFKDSPLLEKVDFVNNDISDIDVNTLKGLTKLTTFRLNHNNLSFILPELFTDTSELRTLHLSHNNINNFSDHILEKTPKLEELDLSNNKLSRVPGETLKEFLSLNSLKMTNNLIRSVDTMIPIGISTFRNLKTLDLSANNISGNIDIRGIDTGARSNKLSIDLSGNKIERVMLSKHLMTTKKVKFLLTKNPLVCDCYATEIKEEAEAKMYDQEKLFNVDVDDFVCSDKKNLLETSYADLTCPFPSEILNEKCPQNCSCNLNRYNRTVSVNCAGQSLSQIPENLPLIPRESDEIILHMENNFLTNLTDSLLRLSKNNLSNFESITKMYLSGNRLKYIGHSFPSKLRYLGLDNNKIQSYQNKTLQYFHQKVEGSKLDLKLGKNPYDCNCNSLELNHFLKMFYSHVEDSKQVTLKCLDTEKELFILNEKDFCSSFSLITALIPAIFIFIILCILLILHISYKETIMIYVFSKSWGKIFFSEDQVDKNKPYDAFLSYSHHDEDFVEKTLLPGLESEDNPKELQYKCLIHTRDWNVGDMISDQIIESIETSRRTIIVLSVGYIKSMWSKLEFQAAHAKAMKENTQRVIIILHGEIPEKDDLDEDVKKYLKTNTYIDTNDPWFWKKLRYALPKKSYKQKKSSELHDKSKDTADYENAKQKSIHDTSEDNPNQNKVQLPYYKQFSRELLLTSESLKRDLGGTEYIC